MHYVRILVENIKNVIKILKRGWKTVLLAISMLTSFPRTHSGMQFPEIWTQANQLTAATVSNS